MPSYTLYIETDDDFHVIFDGNSYWDRDTIIVDNIDDLLRIKAIGHKTDEFTEGVEAIIGYGLSEYNSIGGNRGIRWTKLDVVPSSGAEYYKLLELQAIAKAATIRDLSQQVEDLTTQRNELWSALKEAVKS